MDYHLLPAPEVAQALRTTPAGLDAATATQRLAKYDPNRLADTRRKAWWQLLLRQFTDVMILVLMAGRAPGRLAAGVHFAGRGRHSGGVTGGGDHRAGAGGPAAGQRPCPGA